MVIRLLSVLRSVGVRSSTFLPETLFVVSEGVCFAYQRGGGKVSDTERDDNNGVSPSEHSP